MERQDIIGESGGGKRFAAMPEKEAMEDQKDFFVLWSTITEACREDIDDAPFDQVCEKIFKNEYPDGKEAMEWLEEETAKICDPQLREKVMGAAEELATKSKYFYLAVGFALGQDYDVSCPEAREQIEYLRERIRKAGIFPLIAKRM
jgi:hypothetical protein